LEFLRFSGKNEEEADYLGLQYMYKANPSAFVSMFEKLEAKERAKPGSISKLFSTHPPTPDRIEMTKKNIEQILSNREQYIVTTSEFEQIKARITAIEKQPPRTQTNTNDKEDHKQPSDDDRPVLKRKPYSAQ
jgi:predicted Zn-dependent protease